MGGIPSGGGPPEMMSAGSMSGSGSSGASAPSRNAETEKSFGSPGIWATSSGTSGAAMASVVVAAGAAVAEDAASAVAAAVASGADTSSSDEPAQPSNAMARPPNKSIGTATEAIRRGADDLSRADCCRRFAIRRRYSGNPEPTGAR